MAAHDTHTPGRLAAMLNVSPTDLAEARAIAALRRENEALREALTNATADLARAHGNTLMVIRARTLAEAHQVADADVVELVVAHGAALKALETIGRPEPGQPGNVVPFPGRRA